MLDNTWRKLETKLPVKLLFPACVSVLDHQYVLLFGGSNENGINQGDIYVYSILDQMIAISNTKCPEKEYYEAIAINDKVKDSLTTFGYVRWQWGECGINDLLFLPEYLIRIICGYYLNEWVHLFGHKTGKHYKIDVFDIINNNC